MVGSEGTADPDGGPFRTAPRAARAVGEWLRAALGSSRAQVLVSGAGDGETRATASRLRTAVARAVEMVGAGGGLLVYVAAPVVCTADDAFILLDDGLAAMPEATGVSLSSLMALAGGAAGSATIIACDTEGLPLGSSVRPRPAPALDGEGDVACVFSCAPESQGGPLRDGRAILSEVLRESAGHAVGPDDLVDGVEGQLRMFASNFGRTVSGSAVWRTGMPPVIDLPSANDDARVVLQDASADEGTNPNVVSPMHAPYTQSVPHLRRKLANGLADWLMDGEKGVEPSMLLLTGMEGVGKDFVAAQVLGRMAGEGIPWARLGPRDRRIPFRAPMQIIRASLEALGDDMSDGDLADAVDRRLRDLPPSAARRMDMDRGPWSRETLVQPLRMLEDIESLGDDIPPDENWSRDLLLRTGRALAIITLTLARHGSRILRISDLDLGGVATLVWLKSVLRNCDVPGLKVVVTARRNVFGRSQPDARIQDVEVGGLDRSDTMELLVETQGLAAARAMALHDALAGRVDPMMMVAEASDEGAAFLRVARGDPKTDREIRRRMTRVLDSALEPKVRRLLQLAAQLDEPVDTTLLSHLVGRMDIAEELRDIAEAGLIAQTPDGPVFTRCWVRDTLAQGMTRQERDRALMQTARACKGRLVGKIHKGQARRRVWYEVASMPVAGREHAEILGPIVGLGRALRVLGLEQAAMAIANELGWLSKMGGRVKAAGLEQETHAMALLWMADVERMLGRGRQATVLADAALLVAPSNRGLRAELTVERCVLMSRHYRRLELYGRAREELAKTTGDHPWRVMEAIESEILVDPGRLANVLESAGEIETLALRIARAHSVPGGAELREQVDDDDEGLRSADEDVEVILREAWDSSRDVASTYGGFRALLSAARNAWHRGALLDVPVLAARAVGCARSLGDLAGQGEAWDVLCPGLGQLQGGEAVMLTLQDARALALERRDESEAVLITLLLAERALARGRLSSTERMVAPLEKSSRIKAVGYLGNRYRKLMKRAEDAQIEISKRQAQVDEVEVVVVNEEEVGASGTGGGGADEPAE